MLCTFYTVWYRNSFFASDNSEVLSIDFKYAFFCVLVNGGGMLIYTLVMHLINERAANDRLREKEIQMLLKQKQFDALQDRIEEARIAKHDMCQHFHLLSADKRYDELDAYINRFHKKYSDNSAISYCDHYGINALLQYFAGVAMKQRIQFSAQTTVPTYVNIPDDVLAVLVGNLLENVLEACSGEKQPQITVRRKMEDNALIHKYK